MIRFLDVVLSAMGLLVALPVMLVLWLMGWWDMRSSAFRQERVGRYQRPFTLEKLRTLTPKEYFRYLVQTLTGKGSGDRVRSA